LKDLIIYIFENYGTAIISMHLISAILFIGSLFAIRFLFCKPIESISDDEERYSIYLKLLQKFFILSFVLIAIIFVVAVLMEIGMKFEYGNPTGQAMVRAKELIWLFIIINLAYMYIKYRIAKKAFKNNLMIEAGENIILIVNYLIPYVLVFGLLAILLGTIVRGC
jgi:uncharacterized membrane protein